MKLYVCWGTFQVPGMRSHPCRNAYLALKDAGHDPELVKAHSSGALPAITRGRREVKELSGSSWVPLLVTDDGEVIGESQKIIDWAREHPAAGAAV
jgi:glutathione S-transferase